MRLCRRPTRPAGIFFPCEAGEAARSSRATNGHAFPQRSAAWRHARDDSHPAGGKARLERTRPGHRDSVLQSRPKHQIQFAVPSPHPVGAKESRGTLPAVTSRGPPGNELLNAKAKGLDDSGRPEAIRCTDRVARGNELLSSTGVRPVFRPHGRDTRATHILIFFMAATDISWRLVFFFRAGQCETPSPLRSCSKATWHCPRVPECRPVRRVRR
jgi:hypothetical protein